MHDITHDTVTNAMKLHVDVLTKLCGTKAISNGVLTIVSTRWSPGISGTEKKREAWLMENHWPRSGDNPPSTRRVGNRLQAKELVDSLTSRLLTTDPSTILLIQDEIINNGLPARRTQAGNCFTYLEYRDTDMVIP